MVTSESKLHGQDFQGLVALITGGAMGIGLATADYLSARGAKIAILDPTPVDNPEYFGLRCDITNDSQVVDAVARVVEKFGAIDILINNAGIGAAGQVSENADDEWAHVFNVNVFGAVRVTRAALPTLKKSKNAVIVFSGSVVGEIGVPNRVLYSATKGALETITRAMAADFVADGIRVNAVSPGTADTPWIGRLLAAADDPAAASAALKARQPMKRLITPQEVAHAIAYLAHPLSTSTTGTVLSVDAGMHSLRVG
jgi:2-keto-3-deoxy-L-fuconate dehydrogenase